MGHIYRIINVANDHFYLGSAVNFRRRKWEHLQQLKQGRHHCVRLQKAWDEFGADAFEFELLEEVDDVRLASVEDAHLVQWAGRPECYNTAHTAMHPPSSACPQTRQKISETLRSLYSVEGAHPRIGKTHSEETRAKISASKLANPQRPWLGKTRSAETKAKIAAAQKGKPKAPRTFTPEGLARAQENMKRNARAQLPADFADVLAKFPADVQARYDFSKAQYAGALVRIEGVACPDHGVFSQYAAQFRKGRGCPQCGAEQRAESKRQQMRNAWATQEGRELFVKNRKPRN